VSKPHLSVIYFPHRAGNRTITKTWFDSRCGSASLCPWSQGVYPSWWPV